MLAAEEPLPTDTVPELEIISRPEVFPDHFLQSPVFCQRTLYDLSFCLPAEYPPLVIQLRKGEKPVMTVIVLILVLFFFLLHKPIIPAHRKHRRPLFQTDILPLAEGCTNGGGTSLSNNDSTLSEDGDRSGRPIHIQEKLGGIPDARNRLERMSAPQQREICHRIQLEQIRSSSIPSSPLFILSNAPILSYTSFAAKQKRGHFSLRSSILAFVHFIE